MIVPKHPDNESDRQREVEKYKLLDTLAEEGYDNITSLMSFITNSPISLITLLDKDRNYMKSNLGFPATESPRALSFCGHAINAEEDIMIVEDARKDERFHDNPIVSDHKAIFYAGVPLVNPNGFKLGTLCVYDHKPRTLNKKQINALKAMSKQVVNLFEFRLQNAQLIEAKEKLEIRNQELNKFAQVISHDLKSPLGNIMSLTELLEEENDGKLSDASIEYLEYLKESSATLKNYIDGTLEYYKSDNLLNKKKEVIAVETLLNEVKEITIPKTEAVGFTYSSNVKNVNANKSVLLQVLINLVTNGIKYNCKGDCKINIEISENDLHYNFKVTDNGNGIPESHLDKIFNLFSIVGIEDKNGDLGTGIGLASVKKLVESQNGIIKVESTLDVGSSFQFSIEK